MSTLKMVKAAIDERKAKEEQAKLEEQRKLALCVKAFDPLYQMFLEVKDHPSRHYRDRGEVVPFEKVLATNSRTELTLWDSTGNYGQTFACVWGPNGPEYRVGAGVVFSKGFRVVDLETLQKEFVKCLADYLIIMDNASTTGPTKKSKD